MSAVSFLLYQESITFLGFIRSFGRRYMSKRHHLAFVFKKERRRNLVAEKSCIIMLADKEVFPRRKARLVVTLKLLYRKDFAARTGLTFLKGAFRMLLLLCY